jgi:hypothetical protein
VKKPTVLADLNGFSLSPPLSANTERTSKWILN